MVKDFLGQKRMDEMFSLGEANLEVLRQLDRWCKHLDATPTSAGMLASVSGLPIGSFRLTCRHARSSHESINLQWISREFLEENCRNCPHHEPDGDPSWGRQLLVQTGSQGRRSRQYDGNA